MNITPEELAILSQSAHKEIECPFCLISENKLPAIKVYEDNVAIAALEINPAAIGHTIIFPKTHSAEQSDFKKIQNAINKVTSALLKIYPGVTILTDIKYPSKFGHLVVNLIPRAKDDNINFNWTPRRLTKEQLQEIASRISSALISEQPEQYETKSKLDVKRFEEYEEQKQKRIPD